jgi:hypothetical protein
MIETAVLYQYTVIIPEEYQQLLQHFADDSGFPNVAHLIQIAIQNFVNSEVEEIDFVHVELTQTIDGSNETKEVTDCSQD